MMNQSIHLDASMDHWDEFMSFIELISQTKSLSEKKSYRFKLAAEELLSNIVRSSESSYQSTSHLAALQITYSIVSSSNTPILQVVLTDNAPPFDPEFETLNSPDHIDVPVALRPIGGLGLFLVKDSVDSVSYKYCNDQNTYTLEIELDVASD